MASYRLTQLHVSSMHLIELTSLLQLLLPVFAYLLCPIFLSLYGDHLLLFSVLITPCVDHLLLFTLIPLLFAHLLYAGLLPLAVFFFLQPLFLVFLVQPFFLFQGVLFLLISAFPSCLRKS